MQSVYAEMEIHEDGETVCVRGNEHTIKQPAGLLQPARILHMNTRARHCVQHWAGVVVVREESVSFVEYRTYCCQVNHGQTCHIIPCLLYLDHLQFINFVFICGRS